MFDGKMKAVTFSYDDGVTQDRKLIKLFNKYGLKATFNVNSDLLDCDGRLIIKDRSIPHVKFRKDEVKGGVYDCHEVAVHTLTHPNLTGLDEEEIVRQVEQDRLQLSELVGYEVFGMAYPCGGVNNDDRVAEIIGRRTGVKYSRTITENSCFDIQQNLLRFNPTVHHTDFEKLNELADEFIKMKADRPQIFYIWGHSYEFDIDDTWNEFEAFLEKISKRDDIFYGTNSQVLLGK